MRLDDLEPHERRTIRLLRARPKRALPNPKAPARPELGVYKRIASLRAASAQRDRDHR